MPAGLEHALQLHRDPGAVDLQQPAVGDARSMQPRHVGLTGGHAELFCCLAALTPLDRGSAILGGQDASTLGGRERRRIAVVCQQFNLVNRPTARQNALAGRLGHVPAWRGWLRRFRRGDHLLAFTSRTSPAASRIG